MAGVKFPPKGGKSNIFCCVYGCNSKASRNPELSFHHFPEVGKTTVKYINKMGEIELVDRRKLWEKKLRMGKKVTTSMRVCSLHFVEDDYSTFTRPNYPAKSRFLKNISVPSINLPQSSIETAGSSNNKVDERQIRLANRRKRMEVTSAQNDSTPQEEEERGREMNVEEKSNVQEKILINVGVQVKSGDLMGTCFFDFLKTDEQLSTATGIKNFKLFNDIVAAVTIAVPHLNHAGVLNISDRVLITFIKLKQNLSYSFLSVLFPTVSRRYCSEIICNMIDILNDVLITCIHFPSGDEILRNMPLCFEKYTDTRIILDCTEIKIQKPKNLCCQITMYSNYKGNYTIKFMTGVTPGGIISFISNPYGGRTSDKAIFEQSLLLQQLEEGVAIMVDRGFLIDELCNEHGVKVIRPPFLNNQDQFSEDDATENADIASARVHIERLNQRLKVFEILGGKMSVNLVPKSKKIMTILCAIVNLSSPIFKDDKFHS